jgi:twinkle protein
MAELLDIEEVSLEEYYEQIERVFVLKASSYAEQLVAEFAPRTDARRPTMFSTKLRLGLEFRPGEVTCYAGYNGHRKSMFTGQVVIDLVAQKQRILVASLEMQPVQTLARMARQAWGDERLTAEQLRRFAEWTNGKLWLLNHLGRLSPHKLLALARYFGDKLCGHHIVIDSMMMVCASEESLDEQKQFVTDLVRFAQEAGVHIHLVTHCRKPQNGEERPPTKYDLRGSAAISDQAHNVVTIWANKAKKAKADEGSLSAINEPDARVSVEKQRNGRWEGACKLWFDESSLRFRDDSSSAIHPYAGLQP